MDCQFNNMDLNRMQMQNASYLGDAPSLTAQNIENQTGIINASEHYSQDKMAIYPNESECSSLPPFDDSLLLNSPFSDSSLQHLVSTLKGVTTSIRKTDSKVNLIQNEMNCLKSVMNMDSNAVFTWMTRIASWANVVNYSLESIMLNCSENVCHGDRCQDMLADKLNMIDTSHTRAIESSHDSTMMMVQQMKDEMGKEINRLNNDNVKVINDIIEIQTWIENADEGLGPINSQTKTNEDSIFTHISNLKSELDLNLRETMESQELLKNNLQDHLNTLGRTLTTAAETHETELKKLKDALQAQMDDRIRAMSKEFSGISETNRNRLVDLEKKIEKANKDLQETLENDKRQFNGELDRMRAEKSESTQGLRDLEDKIRINGGSIRDQCSNMLNHKLKDLEVALDKESASFKRKFESELEELKKKMNEHERRADRKEDEYSGVMESIRRQVKLDIDQVKVKVSETFGKIEAIDDKIVVVPNNVKNQVMESIETRMKEVRDATTRELGHLRGEWGKMIEEWRRNEDKIKVSSVSSPGQGLETLNQKLRELEVTLNKELSNSKRKIESELGEVREKVEEHERKIHKTEEGYLDALDLVKRQVKLDMDQIKLRASENVSKIATIDEKLVSFPTNLRNQVIESIEPRLKELKDSTTRDLRNQVIESIEPRLKELKDSTTRDLGNLKDKCASEFDECRRNLNETERKIVKIEEKSLALNETIKKQVSTDIEQLKSRDTHVTDRLILVEEKMKANHGIALESCSELIDTSIRDIKSLISGELEKKEGNIKAIREDVRKKFSEVESRFKRLEAEEINQISKGNQELMSKLMGLEQKMTEIPERIKIQCQEIISDHNKTDKDVKEKGLDETKNEVNKIISDIKVESAKILSLRKEVDEYKKNLEENDQSLREMIEIMKSEISKIQEEVTQVKIKVCASPSKGETKCCPKTDGMKQSPPKAKEGPQKDDDLRDSKDEDLKVKVDRPDSDCKNCCQMCDKAFGEIRAQMGHIRGNIARIIGIEEQAREKLNEKILRNERELSRIIDNFGNDMDKRATEMMKQNRALFNDQRQNIEDRLASMKDMILQYGRPQEMFELDHKEERRPLPSDRMRGPGPSSKNKSSAAVAVGPELGINEHLQKIEVPEHLTILLKKNTASGKILSVYYPKSPEEGVTDDQIQRITAQVLRKPYGSVKVMKPMKEHKNYRKRSYRGQPKKGSQYNRVRPAESCTQEVIEEMLTQGENQITEISFRKDESRSSRRVELDIVNESQKEPKQKLHTNRTRNVENETTHMVEETKAQGCPVENHSGKKSVSKREVESELPMVRIDHNQEKQNEGASEEHTCACGMTFSKYKGLKTHQGMTHLKKDDEYTMILKRNQEASESTNKDKKNFRKKGGKGGPPQSKK